MREERIKESGVDSLGGLGRVELIVEVDAARDASVEDGWAGEEELPGLAGEKDIGRSLTGTKPSGIERDGDIEEIVDSLPCVELSIGDDEAIVDGSSVDEVAGEDDLSTCQLLVWGEKRERKR